MRIIKTQDRDTIVNAILLLSIQIHSVYIARDERTWIIRGYNSWTKIVNDAGHDFRSAYHQLAEYSTKEQAIDVLESLNAWLSMEKPTKHHGYKYIIELDRYKHFVFPEDSGA